MADPGVTTADGRVNTEVRMVPAAKTAGFPGDWPIDGRAGGVPDPATRGPSFIQIGTEGGFLPAPVLVPNQPVAWNMVPTTFNFGNVTDHALLIGTAERADVIIDFSAFAGKTLILYNDAPAAFPALDPRYDYYTGNPDLTGEGGTPATQPGYGPNIRTIMQIRVSASSPAPSYDLANLESVFARTGTKRGVFEVSQDEIIVPDARYNSAYDTTFPVDTYVRIQDNFLTFKTVSGSIVTLPLEPKAMQDEMGEAYDMDYGRMSGMLGVELPMTQAGVQNFILYGYASPPVEIVKGTTYGTPIGTLDDGTQIWKITHNGVDTHTIHTHLFNAQLINRVGWDGAIRPPDANELGWKETFRVSPLEDTIIAFRPILPNNLPFQVPNSVRLIDPTMQEGDLLKTVPGGFITPTGEPVTVTNHYVNFGWEYVWHCHILAHEEMDMMHSLVLAVAPETPSNLTAYGSAGSQEINLTWNDNSINETGFTIQRATNPKFTANLTTFVVAKNQTAYTDNTGIDGTTYYYRIFASNLVGDTEIYIAPAIGFPNKSADSGFSNTAMVGTPVVITTTSLPFGVRTILYSQTLAATGGYLPYMWSLSAGALPLGLTLSSSGIISGIPAALGTFDFTVQVTDGAGLVATKPLSLLIVDPLVITTLSPLPVGIAGTSYSVTILASGGLIPYTWSLTGGSLPAGLLLSGTGVLSGIPVTRRSLKRQADSSRYI
ncbi:putative Ig domain-containing protein [Candidatus Desantisbacteria bacterium]|nr:putative Ig domain-containing protein [Candidatus Desantisbacteria bacterium]